MSESPASRRAETRTSHPAGHIFLVGFMGAGKSTVGRLLAKRLDLPFLDLDDRIAERSGRSIPEIFEAMGEPAFRALESSELAELEGSSPAVVACGGGIVLDEGNRRLMERIGTTVLLEVSAEDALARTGDSRGRPLLRDACLEDARGLLQAREHVYRSAADICVDTQGRSAVEVADAVSTALEEGSA